ncbi:hypothetical protein N9X12_04340 [Alphaproteobacteria bacterium]|nr:hypothetical protein [Alphaproteobacteria bacterium]
MQKLSLLFSLVILMFLGACGATTTTVTAPPKFEADKFQPLRMNARRMEIIENWQMPVQAPYIGYLANPAPSNVVIDWASKILMPAGASGELVLDISRASLTRSKLPRTASLNSLITDEQESKIEAQIEARLIWLQPVGGFQGMIELSARHSVTIAESSSANDLNIAVQEALLAAVNLLDKQAREEIAKIPNITVP